MPGKLFNPHALEPIAQPHEFMLLQEGDRPFGANPFYEVLTVEGLLGGSTHGTIILFSHSAAAPTGYTLDKQGVGGQTLAAAANVGPIQPLALVFAQNWVGHMRFMLRFLGLPAGLVADDIDLQPFLPRALARWSALNWTGRLNSMYQPQLPGDAIAGPAQAANLALPAAFPQFLPWHEFSHTEMFWLADNSPAFQINNNGAVASAAGMAVGLDIFGFAYKLKQVTDVPPNWIPKRLFGQDIPAPPDRLDGTFGFASVPIQGTGVR